MIGRYYAMDRDQRWERVKKAYDLIVKGEGTATTDAIKILEENYANGTTDEFIPPTVMVDDNGAPLAPLKEGDVVIFFNFRTDRGRELTQVLSQKDMPEADMKRLNLYYVTLTNYDDSFENIKISTTRKT